MGVVLSLSIKKWFYLRSMLVDEQDAEVSKITAKTHENTKNG